jgi:tubulin polyglutamylase TTLL6/13
MVTVDMLYKMKPYQRINHFPGMYNLSRKSNMCIHLKVLRKAFPKNYLFYPITWVLPAEAGEFKEYYRKVYFRSTFYKIIYRTKRRSRYISSNQKPHAKEEGFLSSSTMMKFLLWSILSCRNI